MALAPTVSAGTIADCSTLTITDTTGAYNVSTNPGGYGTPNAARADFGILMFVTNKMTTGDVPLTVTNGNAHSVSSWTVTFTVDGWYEYYMALAPIWASGPTFAEGDVCYSVAEELFYVSLQAGNTNHAVTDGAWWEATTDIEDFVNASNVVRGLYDDVIYCNSQSCAATANAEMLCGCSAEDSKKYNQIIGQLDGVIYSFGSQNYYEAQKKLETLQAICSDLNCLDC
jgi:hypothetical protein